MRLLRLVDWRKVDWPVRAWVDELPTGLGTFWPISKYLRERIMQFDIIDHEKTLGHDQAIYLIMDI
jgi:hypothetical protein